MRKCEAEGCNNGTWATGKRIKRVTNQNALRFCRKHCRWIDQYGSVESHRYARGPIEFRFWKHVKKRENNECWEWQAYCNENGYGRLWDLEKRINRLVHRVSYELHFGELPDDLVVMHKCDNRKCVNPKHLRLGTFKENTQDMIQKGRRITHKRFGEDNPVSKLTLEQAKFIKAHPELGHKAIADMFGLSPNCIRSVRIGRTWKDA